MPITNCDDHPAGSNPSADGLRNFDALLRFNQRRIEGRYAASDFRTIRSVGVVGAGTMGAGIAGTAICAGLLVLVADESPKALELLPRRILADFAQSADPSRLREADLGGGLLRIPVDLREFAACDLVVETVVEKLFVKEALLQELEGHLRPGVVLGSNTSTLSIDRLATRLSRPEQFCGIHFFAPVSQHRLIEIVRGPRSSPAAICQAVALARILDRVPLVVPDGPAFVVNRLMQPYLSEVLQLLLEGATGEQVEYAAADFGMSVGPLALIDSIGMDILLDGAWALADRLGESLVASPPLVALVKAGRLGRKSGSGFYLYREEAGRQVAEKLDPTVPEIFARWRHETRQHTRESITARLFLPMLLEATRILAQGGVDDPRDIDLAVVLGCLGFPAARGGLLYWADSLGASQTLEMLEPLASLGPRMQPTALLKEMAETGRRFYRIDESENS